MPQYDINGDEIQEPEAPPEPYYPGQERFYDDIPVRVVELTPAEKAWIEEYLHPTKDTSK